MYQLYRDRPILVLCMVLGNIALSAWCLNFDPVINNDGVTYLNLAQLMLDGKWNEAYSYYSWPFYPAFIAFTAKLTFLDLETSAYLLNTILATSLTLAFVCIVGELSNNDKRIILIAALVILLFPSITKYRSFIIRDFGYLSCYLWSLYFVFRFIRTLDKRHLLGWLTFAGLSCLFRFEGLAFVLIAPYFLVLFTATKMPHRRIVLTSLSVAIVIACVGLTYWYINDKYSAMIEMAQAAGKDINNIFDLFLSSTKQKLGGGELTSWNYLEVILSNMGNVAYELIRRMAIFYFLFAIYAYIKNIGFNSKLSKRVWIVYVATNVCVLLVFSLYNNFLVSRYTMATALTLLILSPFVINRILLTFSNFSLLKRSAGILAISLITLTSIEGLIVNTKKSYVKEAGLWAKENLPAGASLYSNDPLIVYYGGHGPTVSLNEQYSLEQLSVYMDMKHTRNFDYIAVSSRLSKLYEDVARQTLAFRFGMPIKVIKGDDDRAVYIFKTERETG